MNRKQYEKEKAFDVQATLIDKSLTGRKKPKNKQILESLRKESLRYV